jgi:3',5'-cyclic AMP phosphodiesterase CpdA
MLGNHDRRDAFLQVFDDAEKTDSGHVQTVLDLPRHRIITLDTLDGPPYSAGHHSGALCAKRHAWLSDALSNLDGRIPLVFAHHPPFDTGIPGMDMIKLKDGDALLDQLPPHPAAYLFCGHIHRTISGSTKGVAWTMFKSPAHQGVLDLKNPDSSLSVNEPSAYGVLLLTPEGVVAHSQDVIAGTTPVKDPASTSTKVPDLQ